MATSLSTTPGAAPEHPILGAVSTWVKAHKQVAGWVTALLVIALAIVVINAWSKGQSEQRAGQQLVAARLAFESHNYPLAGSELSRIVENYSGTQAAQGATILLVQVRLAQGQSQQAIGILREFAPKADQNYRAQSYGLLGAAYENVAHASEAAEAYEQAARSANLPFLRAQYLSDAGRAWIAAGDTARGVSVYREIVAKLDSTTTVVEARVRLGELTKGAAQAP